MLGDRTTPPSVGACPCQELKSTSLEACDLGREGAHSNRLEGLPEIERENILAGRLEEMQKLKDSMQLDAMYKMAGMGGDEEEEDDEPSRKKRECECRVSGTY
jgi:hypothetical protein